MERRSDKGDSDLRRAVRAAIPFPNPVNIAIFLTIQNIRTAIFQNCGAVVFVGICRGYEHPVKLILIFNKKL